MAKSVKINYALTLFDIFMGIAFPLLTMPYVARILTPTNIGHVYFYLNILSYITLVVALGIPLYGVREIAKERENVAVRNKTAIELLVLHIILTAIGYLVVFILCFSVDKIKEDIPLFAILSISLFFSTIGVSWFFQAIEDFKYITIRSLIVKVISLILLFALVRSREDIIWYGVVLVCGSVGNNIFNFLRLRKFISWKDINNNINPFRHVKPASKVFVLNLTIGIYTQLSVFLLGFLQSDADVGYYTMAQKIVTVLNSIILALTTVLLPRLSKYVGNRQESEFKELGDKAISFVLAISLPICVGLITLSRPIIMVVFGENYEPSIIVLKIWAPIIMIIGLSQIYGKSILYSTGHEMLMTICTFIGMLAYLLIGIPGVLYYSIVGASVASFCAELIVTGSMVCLGRNYHPCTFMRKQNLVYIVAGFFMFVVMLLCVQLSNNYYLQIVTSIPLGVISYMQTLKILGSDFYFEIEKLCSRILHKLNSFF